MTFSLKALKEIPKSKKLIATALLVVIVIASCMTIGKKGDDAFMSSANYKNGKFMNALPNKEYSVGDYVKVTWDFLFGGHKRRVPKDPIPVVAPKDFQTPPSSALRYNWLGHSSIILELEGKRLLLDPVFSERISFSQLVGPKRFHPTPISLEELPPIDIILISHNHYDHLDRLVVGHFKNKEVQFCVPMGVGKKLIDWGVHKDKVAEFDWWQEFDADGLTIVSTPARHFSGRGLFDRDEAFWTSWSIIGKKHKVFFSGDTGMTPQFSEIGDRLGPFDLAFIKMGAYDEQWPDIHLNPEQAVQAHKMLKGNHMVPIHWGTFDLALHSWQEPIERFIVAAENANIAFITSKVGETVNPAEHENSYWWRGLD